jgi:hypothetical protein
MDSSQLATLYGIRYTCACVLGQGSPETCSDGELNSSPNLASEASLQGIYTVKKA